MSQQLSAAAAAAAERGIPVRALLVTNPNNPLGTVYSEEEVKEMIAWCLQHNVHYVRCDGMREREKEIGCCVCVCVCVCVNRRGHGAAT